MYIFLMVYFFPHKVYYECELFNSGVDVMWNEFDDMTSHD